MKLADIRVGNDYAVTAKAEHVVFHGDLDDHLFDPREGLLRSVARANRGDPGPLRRTYGTLRARVTEVGVPLLQRPDRKGVRVEMTGHLLRRLPESVGFGTETDDEGNLVYDDVTVEAVIPPQNVKVDWAEVEAARALAEMERQAVKDDWAAGRRFITAHAVWSTVLPRDHGAVWDTYVHADDSCPLAARGKPVRSRWADDDDHAVHRWGDEESCPFCFAARAADVGGAGHAWFTRRWDDGV